MRFMEGMKRWGLSLLLLIILLGGCHVELTPEAAGQEVIDLLQAGDYQAVHEEWFTEKLQESLPLNELQDIWEKQIKKAGEFREVNDLAAENRGENTTVIEANIAYTNTNFDIRMIFNEKQLLVGFHLSGGEDNISPPDSIVEEAIIVGEGTDYELEGILTLPAEGQKNLPAVVLVHGSGPSDRDETAFAYKPFRDIAWGLAEQGIAVIRYDKRTFSYGEKMAQEVSKLTVFEETIEDAILATELLKEDDERMDKDNLFLIGHSLGGMLAPRIDAQGGDYTGIITLAGSPRPLWEIIYDQNKAALENYPMDKKDKKKQEALVKDEYEKAKQLQHMTDEEAQESTVFGVNGFYLKEMDQYDPASIISGHNKPLLVLQGEDDFQVYYEKDFAIWKKELKDRENTTLISYPHLNHFFVDYDGPNKGTVAEYETPGQVDEAVIKDISEWILELKKNGY